MIMERKTATNDSTNGDASLNEGAVNNNSDNNNHTADGYTIMSITPTFTVAATFATKYVKSYSSTSMSSSENNSLHSRIALIAYCYVLPIICVIGIIGNITNLITLASKKLRAVSYMYLRALAVADLLCMIFVLLFVSGEIVQRAGIPLNQSPIYGFYQAHLMLSLINWALATGVLIVVALSLDRFISIVFPMYFRTWNAPQRALKLIIGAYLMSGIFHIPYGIGRYTVGERVSQQGVKTYAAVDSETSKTIQWQVYKWTREGLLRFAPILILSILNIQIMTAFRRRQKRSKNRKKRITGSSIGGGNKEDTLVYILGGIVAMFFVCNIPAALNLLFINETIKLRLDYQIFRAVANLLEIINHASQFYVFCACSTDYRTTFLQKFPCLTLSSRYRQESRVVNDAHNRGDKFAGQIRSDSIQFGGSQSHTNQTSHSGTMSNNDARTVKFGNASVTRNNVNTISDAHYGTVTNKMLEMDHRIKTDSHDSQYTMNSPCNNVKALINCEKPVLFITYDYDILREQYEFRGNLIEASSSDDFL